MEAGLRSSTLKFVIRRLRNRMGFVVLLLFILVLLNSEGEVLAGGWNGTTRERLDDYPQFFAISTTGINLPSYSTLRKSQASPLSKAAYSKLSYATSAMAEAGDAAVPLIVVYVTVPNKETATSLATSIVTNKLAACVSQVPGITSTYVWEGKVETEQGTLLMIKTRRALLDSLTAHVKSNHPYTVPEVIATPILGGSDSYMKWVVENTQKADEVKAVDSTQKGDDIHPST